ncbi:phage portal protein [Microlunatus sp. Y2014]|uniref:phage portal protein n=1 Tax=Microlunatus sp. Y2014 TaxID=3418488 RepID=UPI003DA70F1D
MNQLLTDLLQKLDNGAQRRANLEAYYHGRQSLAFLSPEARDAIGSRFGLMASNIPRLAVTALAERLRVTGFRAGGQTDLWHDWIGNDLDQLAGVAHREALTLGESYLIVWADATGPRVTVESADQVAVLRDPGTRQIVAAVKRWETKTTTEAVLYGPDEIVRLRANSTGATTTGFHTVETIDNPFGIPPVVALRNSDRLTGDPASEIDDLVPLVDALNKTLADMLVTSEYLGRPRRWATGIELVEDDEGNPVNPIPDGNRTMTSENPDTKFGQLPAADLASYESSVRVLLGQISAVSALPAHYLGILGGQPPSADSLRAAEASLTARAEARQATFGRAWEQVARLMVAARTGADPTRLDVAVSWADAATRSVAQEADAVVKLYAAGLLPATAALARLGYTDDQISEIRTARRAEALDTVGTNLGALINQ